MSLWKKVTLGKIASIKTGKLNSNASKVNGKYPFFTCSQDTFNIDTYSFDTKAILLAGNNAAGIFSIKYYQGKFDVYQRTYVIESLDENVIITRYLYYLLMLELDYFTSVSTGVVTKFLTLNILNNLDIRFPTIDYQIKIVNILSSIDDLVENNLKRIGILTELVRLLYDEWFVNLRYPGYEYTEIVETPHGLKPKDWNYLPIKLVFKYDIGGGWGKDTLIKNYKISAYVIRGTDIPKIKKGDTANLPLRYHLESNVQKRKLENKDIIMEVSGGSINQPVGRALMISEVLLKELSKYIIPASFCKLIRVDQKIVLPDIIYHHINKIYENRQIEKYQVQSTGIKNFKYEYFKEKEFILVPNKKIQQDFSTIISPLNFEISILGLKNLKLKKIRDLLLPKLISGEIDVTDIDIQGLSG